MTAPSVSVPGSGTGDAALARRRWLTAVAWALGVVAAFALNVRLSQTTPANSDGASQALQAWDLLHGNVLQHGWITGDVAYFLTCSPTWASRSSTQGAKESCRPA